MLFKKRKKPQKLFFLQWHITHRCNLRCVHCYQDDFTESADETELSDILDKFCRLLEARSLPGQINLTGGEPLLHPAFFDLAAKIRERGVRLGVLSNGTLIDDKVAARLAALTPVFVQVSLDGTKATHDAIRSKGSFESALSGIDALKRNGVKVLVSFTAQRSNASDFAALAAICRDHAVDKLWWDRVVPENEKQARELSLSTAQFVELLETATKLEREYAGRGKRSMVSNARSLQFLCGSRSPGYVCGAGKELIVILADGTVTPCRRLPYSIGNVRDGELTQIIDQSPLMRRLRLHSPPRECFGCEDLARCEGGAKCIACALTGDPFAKDPNCPR